MSEPVSWITGIVESMSQSESYNEMPVVNMKSTED